MLWNTLPDSAKSTLSISEYKFYLNQFIQKQIIHRTETSTKNHLSITQCIFHPFFFLPLLYLLSSLFCCVPLAKLAKLGFIHQKKSICELMAGVQHCLC